MARIEMTTGIRKKAEEVSQYLETPQNMSHYLCSERLRLDHTSPPLRLGLRLLGQWTSLSWSLTKVEPGKEVVWHGEGTATLTMRYTLTAQKSDRRGHRCSVRLELDYHLPGGPLGKLLEKLRVEREMTAIGDAIIRALPIALEGPPRSGLKHEEP